VKKQYFFGYFFVRAAKPLALLVLLIGIGFCVLQYSQANTAASAAAYQHSAALQRALANLTEAFSATEHIVSAFNADNQLPIPKVQVPRFPKFVHSSADFARVGEMLSKIDQERQQLKHSIVDRFEGSVQSIESKLRAYAASLQASAPSPTPAAVPSPVANVSPLSIPTQQQESLFSSRLSADEVNKRFANLNLRKEFLKVLGSKAENPANRARLSEAVNQLDSLSKLLPEKVESPAEGEPASGPSPEPRGEQGRKIFPSERMALELEQLRGEVRQIVLTSWSVDEVFEQAADLTSAEREKCRVAALAQKSIWLSAASKMLPGMLAAVLVSFLIVICADLVKTLLDTAAHTGVLADAINALRGSIVTSRRQSHEP
jgi:hypothetical protein